MMRRYGQILTTLLATCGFVSTPSAAPALWQVSDSDSSIWLFGSFHLLPPDVTWRTEVFDKTLAAASNVYFETDISDKAQAGVMAETFRLGINPLGVKLTDGLTPDQIKTLTKAVDGIGANLGMLQAMRPWLATTTISVSATVKAGYDPKSGVDMQLQHELPPERQRFFESADEQLGFLASAPVEEQTAQLVDAVSKRDEVQASIDQMVHAWADGDPDKLGKLFIGDMDGSSDAFTNRLIFDRNSKWVETLKTLLAENEQDLVVVGAGHLAGAGSVVDLLTKAGFTVKRLQ